ncbi:prenyltransferase [Thalassotalea maritima]|uniref:prenyltransferase n=1 Tax=Thalassotalea maritima TaxID=3242416 RepID=UPI0035293C0D
MTSTQQMLVAVFKSMRLPFVSLSVLCVLVAFSLAHYHHVELELVDMLIITVGAVAAHIAVNTLNEYQDYRSGLDFHTNKTPFSGGSGALIAYPLADKWVLIMTALSLVICVLIGGYFVYKQGWYIVPFGVIGIAIIVLYTRYLNSHPLLCLIAPGLAFGGLMFIASNLLLTGSVSLASLLLASIISLLVSNILLLNQFPDADIDKQFGRNHVVIAYGEQKALTIYMCFWLLAVSLLVISVVMAVLPTMMLLTLLPLAIGIRIFNGVRRADSQQKLVICLAWNIIMANSALLTMSTSLWLGK